MCVSLYAETERFDQMSDQQHHSPSSPSWLAIQALEERIEAEAPYLKVLAVHVFPYPFLKVKDTVHGIVVGFSSEADYVTYCQIVHRRKGA
jgi:hypothetical protein